MAIEEGGAVELRLHRLGLPHFPRTEFAADGVGQFQHDTADAVSGGKEHAVGADNDRLGRLGPLVVRPRIIQQDGARGRFVDGERRRVDRKDDRLARQLGGYRRGIGGLVGAHFPQQVTREPMVGEHRAGVGPAAIHDDPVAQDEG